MINDVSSMFDQFVQSLRYWTEYLLCYLLQIFKILKQFYLIISIIFRVWTRFVCKNIGKRLWWDKIFDVLKYYLLSRNIKIFQRNFFPSNLYFYWRQFQNVLSINGRTVNTLLSKWILHFTKLTFLCVNRFTLFFDLKSVKSFRWVLK